MNVTVHLISGLLIFSPVLWVSSSCNTPSVTHSDQICKNEWMCQQCLCKMFPNSGENFSQILRCLVAKMSYVASLRFFVSFFGTFWNLMLLFCFFGTIWVFWAFCAVLLQIRLVVIYAIFWVKLFWLKPCSCKKVVFLHLWFRHSLPDLSGVKIWPCSFLRKI